MSTWTPRRSPHAPEVGYDPWPETIRAIVRRAPGGHPYGPLIVGLAIFVLPSAMCAVSSSVAVLIALRPIQGLAAASV